MIAQPVSRPPPPPSSLPPVNYAGPGTIRLISSLPPPCAAAVRRHAFPLWGPGVWDQHGAYNSTWQRFIRMKGVAVIMLIIPPGWECAGAGVQRNTVLRLENTHTHTHLHRIIKQARFFYFTHADSVSVHKRLTIRSVCFYDSFSFSSITIECYVITCVMRFSFIRALLDI